MVSRGFPHFGYDLSAHTEKVTYPVAVPPYPVHGVLESFTLEPGASRHAARIALSYLYSDTCYSHSALLATRGHDVCHTAGKLLVGAQQQAVGAHVEWREPTTVTIHQWIGNPCEPQTSTCSAELLQARALLLLATARVVLQTQGFGPDQAGIRAVTKYWCAPSMPGHITTREELHAATYDDLHRRLMPDMAAART